MTVTREPWLVLLERYLAHEAAVGGLASETLRHRELYLRTYATWWREAFPDRHPTQATTADLSAFLVAESERGIASATRKSQVSALRRFFAWLVLNGYRGDDPTTHLRAPLVRPTEIEIYTPAEARSILDRTAALPGLRGRLRHTIVASLRYTGMRSGELRSLRLDRLDLDAGEARVIGKGSRPRLVVLPPPLLPVLRRYFDEVRPHLPDSPLLLANPHPRVTTAHRGFSHEAVYREVSLAGEQAGVAGRHFPHRWRHTYATELVRAGVDVHLVQRLLGHRSVVSTVGYTHLAADDLKDAIADLW